jgi:hypothetical protein
MKKLLLALCLMLLCPVAFALTPSYSNFDIWYFSINGITIKINTNNVALQSSISLLSSNVTLNTSNISLLSSNVTLNTSNISLLSSNVTLLQSQQPIFDTFYFTVSGNNVKINTNNVATQNYVVGYVQSNNSNIENWVQSQQYISALQTNVVFSSQQITLFSTNALAFSGSNYIGSFPQLYDWNLDVPIVGGGGMVLGTNQFEQVMVSTNGGTNYFLASNGFITTNQVSVSIVGEAGGIGSLTIFGVDHPELLGKTNGFFGQRIQFGNPVNANDAATKGYVDSALHVLSPPVQMAGSWLLNSYTTNGINHVSYEAFNTAILDMASSASYVHIDSFARDSTGTNVILHLAITNLIPGWFVESTTNLNAPIIWTTTSNYTTATNGSDLVLTIPIDLNTQCRFFRIRTAAVTTISINAILYLTARTITNSTDSTFNLGAGVVCADNNYIYRSVGTNQWKRTPFSTW